MLILFILLATLYIINIKFGFFRFNNNNNDEFILKRKILWKNKDIFINGINLSLSYIDFMGYIFRISITKDKDNSNKFYVSFRKNSLENNSIFDLKNINEITMTFDNYQSALSYFYNLKKDISIKLNNDKYFIEFSKKNNVYISF